MAWLTDINVVSMVNGAGKSRLRITESSFRDIHFVCNELDFTVNEMDS